MQIGRCDSSLGKASAATSRVVAALCAGFTVLSALPIALGWPPAANVLFEQAPGLQRLGCLALAVVLGSQIVLIARLDPEANAWRTARHLGFVLLAALLTAIHFSTVDVLNLGWQWGQYESIVRHHAKPPDQYRFLSQGTLWWMFQSNGAFVFSYVAYRLFFTVLVCHAIYQFARLYLSALQGVIVVLVYACFYPLSIRYYQGSLCDPTSHAVMLTALIFCQRRAFGVVLSLMLMGVFIKETMLVIAPCWLLLDPDKPPQWNRRDMLRAGILVAAGMGVFLLCRLPFHFQYDFRSLNRTTELMIWSNLGFSRGHHSTIVSVFERYWHPALFLFMWLPLIIWKRALLPPSLFRTALYLAAALYLTNLCFGWNYESRNFVPALVLLVVSTTVIMTRLVGLNPGVPAEVASPGHPQGST
jgi:hypothetical protein